MAEWWWWKSILICFVLKFRTCHVSPPVEAPAFIWTLDDSGKVLVCRVLRQHLWAWPSAHPPRLVLCFALCCKVICLWPSSVGVRRVCWRWQPLYVNRSGERLQQHKSPSWHVLTRSRKHVQNWSCAETLANTPSQVDVLYVQEVFVCI